MKRVHHLFQGLTICTLIFSFCSCKKEKNLCFQFADFPSGYQFNLIDADTIGFDSPSFNPNNPDELCMITRISDDSSGIFIYNMALNTLTPVYIGKVWETRWGKKGWIVFGYNAQLYKIKSDGSQLTQITFSEQNYNPEWDPEGEYIIFRKIGKAPAYTVSTFIIDEDNRLVDSLTGISFGSGSWGDNNLIATETGQASREICFLSINPLSVLKTLRMLPEYTAFLSINDVQWIPQTNKVIWGFAQGLYITDYETETTYQLRPGCESHTYVNLSVSHDGSKALARVASWRQNDKSKTVEVYSEIYLVDIATGAERRILPP